MRSLVVAVVLLASGVIAAAQPAKKIFHIAYLTGSSVGPNSQAFRQGLRELGYVEGQNIKIELRGAAGNRERLRTLAAELVSLKVDIIVTGGGSDTLAVKQATTTIPIVMTNADDPVASGFVASLARPGGNITGLSTLSPETSGKRLEILKEAIGKITRAAVVGTSTSPGNALALNEIKRTAEALGINLQYMDVLSSKDFEPAFRAADKSRAEGILWLVSGSIGGGGQQAQIAEMAIKSRLPTIYERPQYVTAGGLMSYGVNLLDLNRRAATYVDKILKGSNPGELPVEQPVKFEFVINLKTAKQIGLDIPQWTLMKADRVIK